MSSLSFEFRLPAARYTAAELQLLTSTSPANMVDVGELERAAYETEDMVEEQRVGAVASFSSSKASAMGQRRRIKDLTKRLSRLLDRLKNILAGERVRLRDKKKSC